MLLLPYFVLFVADRSIEVVLPFLGCMLRECVLYEDRVLLLAQILKIAKTN